MVLAELYGSPRTSLNLNSRMSADSELLVGLATWMNAGFVNRLVAADDVVPAAMRMARNIARASPVSVQRTKEAVNRSYDIMGMRQALAAGLDIDVEINATPSFEKSEFARIRREAGVKAAIAWRDSRFTHE